MQQTIQLGQVVQPSVLSQTEAAVENLRLWWRQRSETFTALCGTEGDTFTHGQVVMTHLYLVAVVVIMCVAEWLKGGAA